MRFILVLLLLTLVAPAAMAFTTISYPTRPGYDEPWLDVNRAGYQSILEHLYGAGNYVRIDDVYDKIWYEFDGHATAEAKFAGHAHKIGYTQGVSGGSPVLVSTIFVGPSGYDISGGFDFNFTPNDYLRFNLEDKNAPGTIWSSNEAENVLDSGRDHMVAFQITGGGSAGHYAICWEDLKSPDADWDFNDMIVELRGAGVPEPGTLVLLGVGLLGGGARFLRRRPRA